MNEIEIKNVDIHHKWKMNMQMKIMNQILFIDKTFKMDDMVRNDHMDEFKQPWWNYYT
jgi:hypothetical protein